ncbi:Pre-mRNA-splicing factor spp2 [Orobanche hederae]
MCTSQLRINQGVSKSFVWLKLRRITASRSMSTDAQVVLFLHIVAHNVKNWNCLGALDGAYIKCLVPSEDRPRYRTRKGDIVTNSDSTLEQTMDILAGNAHLMIVSDLDHTMVEHHDPENLSLLRFNALWEANYRNNSLLVYSTGRSPTLYKELRKEKPMITPDITIMSVGTEITYGNSMVPDDGWVDFLNKKWDRNIVSEETSKFSELTLQSETEQRPHKVSFYVQKDKAQDIMNSLSVRLKERGLDVKIIYSGGMDLDILPQGAGKGQALAYLHKKFTAEGILPKNTLVCGDSGNDAELFTIPGVHGVMVSNAQEELLQWHSENAKDNPKIIHATERCAAGIIQAIGRFNLGPNTSPRDVMNLSDSKMEKFDPAYEVVKFYLFYEGWRRAEVENSELLLAKLKAVWLIAQTTLDLEGLAQIQKIRLQKSLMWFDSAETAAPTVSGANENLLMSSNNFTISWVCIVNSTNLSARDGGRFPLGHFISASNYFQPPKADSIKPRKTYLPALTSPSNGCRIFSLLQSKSGTLFRPCGTEQPLHDCISLLRTCYGDKQGKQFRVWVDQVLLVPSGSDSWLVKFKKWEQSGEGRQGCLTTAILSSKDASVAEGLTWVHVHQTWLDEAGPNGPSTWLY